MERNAEQVRARCKELQRYWQPRNDKMKRWYSLIQMVDELATEKLESFVGNDPRSMFNLVLHMLDTKVPHRIANLDAASLDMAGINESVSTFLDTLWQSNETRFRKSGPRQSLQRTTIAFLLATGWYAEFAINSDDGTSTFIEPWNPAQVYPMWDMEMGLCEVAHIYEMDSAAAKRMCRRNGWKYPSYNSPALVCYNYWWVDYDSALYPLVCNSVVLGDGTDGLVKYDYTRFRKIPVYVAPVGGLPDTGALSAGTKLSSQTFNAGGTSVTERWKEEIGQAIVATNENIYRTWNKWWSFSLQLLRDTAQPRIFERSRSGKAIVRPEDVFRRGAIFRGGPDDSVDFIGAPPIPLELRSTQLDLEAMMQRGGVSWAMFGNVSGQLTAYVMSQIAASANQIMRPFHQAIINKYEDEDNDLLEDIRTRGIKPYGWSMPRGYTREMKVTADYDVEIPGELIQKATVARMLDPEFQLSYSYVIGKLFPDIKNPLLERARIRADQAELNPVNALVAYVIYARKQAAYLEKQGDPDAAKLYELAAQAAEAQLQPPQPTAPAPSRQIGNRPEALPRQPALAPGMQEEVQ